MIKHRSGDRHPALATHRGNPRYSLRRSSGDTGQAGQTNPRDLDAEMIARLPVATPEDHHNLFMAIDGVAGGMQDADAPLLAGSVGGIAEAC
jgi:hypothetical protein